MSTVANTVSPTTRTTSSTQQTVTKTRTDRPTTGHSTTVSVTSTQSDQFVCPHSGDFPDERDASSYWHCSYEVEEILECDEHEIFDIWNEKCVFDWGRFIKCDKEGYFKNPYDCHKFYWCIKDLSSDRIEPTFLTCAEDTNGEPLVWDEEKVSCVRNKNDTIRCDDKPLPIDNTDKEAPNDSLLETDAEFRHLYEMNIQCETIGQFRNPYDCHKYYRCYYKDKSDMFLDIEFYKCKDELMVFDEVTDHCVDHTKTSRCLNKQIPAADYYQLPSYDNWINH